MKMQVVGVGKRRFGVGKKSGKDYDGTTIYCLTNSDEVTAGQKAEEIYLNHLSSMTFPDIHVGDLINVEYTRNGFIGAIEVINKKSA